MDKLHVDIECFSRVPIDYGVHKYVTCPDFKIQLISYALNNEPVKLIDLEQGDKITSDFELMLLSPDVIKVAHNAPFEIKCFETVGYVLSPVFWECSMVKALSMGLPAGLKKALEAIEAPDEYMKLSNEGVLFFSKPDGRGRVKLPKDYQDKWEAYRNYNIQDVVSERYLDNFCDHNGCRVDWKLWRIDYDINQRGIQIDKKFCENVIEIDKNHQLKELERAKSITGLDNPNSVQQLKAWLETKGIGAKCLDAKSVDKLVETVDGDVKEVLKIRQTTSNTSTAKYKAMLESEIDGKVYGCMFYYGAHTGRWTSKRVQFQNLPKTELTEQDVIIAKELVYDNIDPRDSEYFGAEILKQMIRPAIISNKGFKVADFSAIEARVLAYYAGEAWVNQVFATHGKIYEAQAAQMYNVTIDQVDKELRSKGKVATLALGYQGSIGALRQMGFKGTDGECLEIVYKYRQANKKIVSFWYWVQNSVILCLENGGTYSGHGITISRDENFLKIRLPSTRIIRYYRPFIQYDIGKKSIAYIGQGKVWGTINTYGGRIVENIVQAIARDCLAVALIRLSTRGRILFHVHDEIVMEDIDLDYMIKVMEYPVTWAKELVLKAAGYTSNYYRKD